MACTKSLDFASVGGAHLSFYWTMDEAGAADKVDSTVGLHWPLANGAVAAVGLFSNGTNCDNPVILNQHRGVRIFSTPVITINQAVSKGLSAWFWLKWTAFGAGGGGSYFLDTSDPLHTNRFRVLFGFFSAISGSMEVGHDNDPTGVFADTPNLTWNLGDWHMVAITYDKVAQTLNIYLDGALSATTADALVYPDLTDAFTELSNVTAPGAGSNFVADEFGLCLNGALTPTQITALWNGGAGVTWPGVTAIVPFP